MKTHNSELLPIVVKMDPKTLLELLRDYVSPILQKEKFCPSPPFFLLITRLNKLVYENGKNVCFLQGIYTLWLLKEVTRQYIVVRSQQLLKHYPPNERFSPVQLADALRIKLFGELPTVELRQTLVQAFTGGEVEDNGSIHEMLTHMIQV